MIFYLSFSDDLMMILGFVSTGELFVNPENCNESDVRYDHQVSWNLHQLSTN